MDSFWEFFWVLVSAFFLLAYLVVLFQVVTDLFRDSSLSGVAKAVWVLMLIVLPVLTSLAYLVFRGRGLAERSAAAAREQDLAGQACVRALVADAHSPADEISRAKELLDSGTISKDEFEQLKQKAMA